MGSGLIADVWVVGHTVRTLKSDENEHTGLLLPADSQPAKGTDSERIARTWVTVLAQAEFLVQGLGRVDRTDARPSSLASPSGRHLPLKDHL